MEEQLSTSAEERDSHPPCPSAPPAESCPNACWRREHSKNEHRTRLFHEETGGLFSSATYSWIFPLLSLGNKRPLEMDDLPELHWTTSAADVFESHLKRHLAHRLGGTEHSEIPSEPPIEDIEVSGDDRPLLSSRRWRRGNADKEPARRLNLWLVITQFVAVDMIAPGLCHLASGLLQFIPPLCLGGIITAIEDAQDPDKAQQEILGINVGWWLVAAMFFSSVGATLALQKHHHITVKIGYGVKLALIAAVYRKTLLGLSGADKQRLGTGKLINLIGGDATKVERMFWFFHLTWAGPLQIIIALSLLYWSIGISGFVGVAVVVLLISAQTLFGRVTTKWKAEMVKKTDARVKHTSELVHGIRVVKCYAWEQPFIDQIKGIRNEELKLMIKAALLQACSLAMLSSGMILMPLSSFALYAFLEPDNFTVVKAFTTLALLDILRIPLELLPVIWTQLIDVNVSLGRYSDLFATEDWQVTHMIINTPENGNGLQNEEARGENKGLAVVVKDATFVWEDVANEAKEEENNKKMKGKQTHRMTAQGDWEMPGLNFEVREGELVMIIGAVGSGKSSLLLALLGEMKRTFGSVEIYGKNQNGRLAYCAQDAWIMNATIQENILFGQPYHKQRYDDVIYVCSLADDLHILPAGDQTEIGERGINLSGGQRARISLARAIYSGAEIILLDDVLSAVDVHVGKHIFENAIRGNYAIAKNSNLPNEKEGENSEKEIKPTRIFVTHQLDFLSSADQIIVMEGGTIIGRGTFEELRSQGLDLIQYLAMKEEGGDEGGSGNEKEDEIVGVRSEAHSEVGSLQNKGDKLSGKIIAEEDRSTGRIRFSVIRNYFVEFGVFLVVVIAIVLVLQSVTKIVNGWWLSIWSTDTLHQAMYYLAIYSIIGAIGMFIILLNQALWAIAGLSVGRSLHEKMLSRVVRAPISFFDSTPVGRILNRFSNDLNVIDQQLPTSMSNSLTLLAVLLSTIIFLVILLPYMIIFLLPIIGTYFYLQNYYSNTTRELRRLDSIAKSPVFAAFQETIDGLATVRGYSKQEIFIRRYERERLDANARPFWQSVITNRWIGVRLEFLGTCILCACALVAVFSRQHIDAGLAGLALTMANGATSALNFTLRSIAETEMNMTSTERVLNYSAEIPQEEPVNVPQSELPPDWPSQGEIEFRDLVMQYREDLPPVLKGINVHIQPKEKIGVCGRTGAGKSSIIQALFRMVECQSGQILIDGIDIRFIGLTDLRSRLSIIPQFPVLFEGSIRYNLDPFQQTNDAHLLWEVLARVQMKDAVTALPHQLDSEVAEGGDNFSAGQKQLLCLARAMLRNSKILILDEATASVDKQTDEIIQQMIRSTFSHSTVLTITHKMETILDCDRILVMKDGQVVEFDRPQLLLADENSQLYGLVRGRAAIFC